MNATPTSSSRNSSNSPCLPADLVAQWCGAVKAAKEIWILSHVRPDGDAYGSTLGLGLALEAAGSHVRMMNEDGMSGRYAFLPGSDRIERVPAEPPAKDVLIVAVDTAEQSRLGPTFAGWNRLPDWNIDHHISNTRYGKQNLIDAGAPAAAQVLFELLQAAKLACPADAASNFFVGLSTDTGSFRHRQTSAHSFEIAAALVRAGADPTQLALDSYQNHALSRLWLLREVLIHLHVTPDERVAVVQLTPELYAKSGANPDQLEGILEYVQMAGSIEVAVLIEAQKDGTCRASLRSRGRVDVQQVAQRFGGGGHRLASGLRTNESAQAVEQGLLAEIEKQLAETVKTGVPVRS